MVNVWNTGRVVLVERSVEEEAPRKTVSDYYAIRREPGDTTRTEARERRARQRAPLTRFGVRQEAATVGRRIRSEHGRVDQRRLVGDRNR